MYSVHDTSKEVGFPIRKFTDQSLFAAPHDLSQRITSFIASQRQGIHQMPFGYLITLICNAYHLPAGWLVKLYKQNNLIPSTESNVCSLYFESKLKAHKNKKKRFSMILYFLMIKPEQKPKPDQKKRPDYVIYQDKPKSNNNQLCSCMSLKYAG